MFTDGKNTAVNLWRKMLNKLKREPIMFWKILFLNEIRFFSVVEFLLNGSCEFCSKFFWQALKIPMICTEFSDLESCKRFFRQIIVFNEVFDLAIFADDIINFFEAFNARICIVDAIMQISFVCIYSSFSGTEGFKMKTSILVRCTWRRTKFYIVLFKKFASINGRPDAWFF